MKQTFHAAQLPSEGSLSQPHRFLTPKASDIHDSKELLAGKIPLPAAPDSWSDAAIWIEGAGRDRLWRLELHSLRWIDCLRRTSDTDKERTTWLELVYNWIDASADKTIASEAWSMSPTIQRCQVMALGIAKWYPDNPPSAIVQSLREHLDFFLLSSSTIQKTLVDQMVVACLLSAPYIPQGEGLLRGIIKNVLENSIDETGLSPADSVLGAITTARAWTIWVEQLANHIDEPQYWLNRLSRARELVTHATTGDGEISGIGTGQRISWSLYQPETRTESYVATCGYVGDPPAELDFVSSSGWGFSRSGWSETERDIRDETTLGVRFGHMHAKSPHDDNSSITFYSGGKEWLTEVPYEYNTDSDDWIHRSLHSSISIDSHEYRRNGKSELIRFKSDMRTREYVLNDSAYRSVQLRRTIVYSDPGNYGTVIDQIRSPDEHDGHQNWIFPSDVNITIDGCTIVATHENRSFYLTSLNSNHKKIVIQDISTEYDSSKIICRRVSIPFFGRSTRLVTVFGLMQNADVPKIKRNGVTGNNVAIDYNSGSHREQLVINKEGSAVGAPEEQPLEIVQRIEQNAVHGSLSIEKENLLRLETREVIGRIKESVYNERLNSSVRKLSIQQLIKFAKTNNITGTRDFGIGSTLIDLAAHDLDSLINHHPLVTQQKRLPVINWENDPDLRHSYYQVPMRSVIGSPVDLSYDLTKYILSMDFGQLVLPTYVNLECPGDTLSVMFHGATDRTRNTLPRFERIRSMESLGVGPIAFFSDPCLDLDSNMILSWYAGNEDINLHQKMALVIELIAKENACKRIVLIGNSGGAFTALQVATYLEDACVVAFNPQIEIDRYAPRIAVAAQENLFGASSIATVPSLAARMNVIKRFEQIGFARRVYFIQNTGDDHHYVEHFLPFKEAFQNSSHPEYLWFRTPDLGPGHRVPAPDAYVQEIRNALMFFNTFDS